MSKYTHIQLLSPKQRYLSDLNKKGFDYDSSQAVAVELLQSLYKQLLDKENVNHKKNFLVKLQTRFFHSRKANSIKGLYLWGGVGRGKTYLMDGFFKSLPFEKKIRLHFHRFMRRVHNDLKRLEGKKKSINYSCQKHSQ